jgi:hypothetical protein
MLFRVASDWVPDLQQKLLGKVRDAADFVTIGVIEGH